MAWTTPRNWSAAEIVGATMFNTHLRDNLNELKYPPFSQSILSEAWSGYATAYTGISSLSATININGGDVLCHLACYVSGGAPTFNLLINQSGYTSANSGLAFVLPGAAERVVFSVWVTGLASGTHVIQPVFKCSGAKSATFRGHVSPTIFWAREVS